MRQSRVIIVKISLIEAKEGEGEKAREKLAKR